MLNTAYTFGCYFSDELNISAFKQRFKSDILTCVLFLSLKQHLHIMYFEGLLAFYLCGQFVNIFYDIGLGSDYY